MRIITTTLTLTVPSPQASSGFLVRHFGFEERLSFDGGVALSHPDGGPELFFLERGIAVLDEGQRDEVARGIIVALTVEDLDGHWRRLLCEGAAKDLVIVEDSWGERSMQVADPNGVILQLVEWVDKRPY